jgi:hypothetical protein
MMDISASQILGDPASNPPTQMNADATEVVGHRDDVGVGYDVSSSDLATAPTTPPATSPANAMPEPESPSTHSEPSESLYSASTEARHEEIELGTPLPTFGSDDRVADLSPIVEQRIQETLEKVAWEAFSDLSETIVKQVIGRIEQIAWEVIPQMAETLVREEIRKMKGEKD